MTSKMINEFLPDYASPPGDTLLDVLKSTNMSQEELARRTGHSAKMINEVIKGKAPLTPDLALELERVLSVPARFWNNQEANYRDTLARIKERGRLSSQVAWLSEMPCHQMVKVAWISKRTDRVDQLIEVLRYFGVASPEQWDQKWGALSADFRSSSSYERDPAVVAAWLRKGELDAQHIDCRPFEKAKFKESLQQIRRLTVEPPEVFQPKAIALCADAGVALAFVREIPKLRTSGATRWLTPDKALIQLSLRYKTDDQLWFTFFHEAGHILLHGKREVFIDENGQEGEKEDQANSLACDLLIPARLYVAFTSYHKFNEKDIIGFAAQLGIAPGIVVGRLQHDGLIPFQFAGNKLKKHFTWKESV